MRGLNQELFFFILVLFLRSSQQRIEIILIKKHLKAESLLLLNRSSTVSRNSVRVLKMEQQISSSLLAECPGAQEGLPFGKSAATSDSSRVSQEYQVSALGPN